MRIVRVIKALRWQEKFSAAATELDTLKGDLLEDLHIHASVITADIQIMLAGVQQDVSAMSALMTLVFQKLRSSEERELSLFAESQGGIDKIVASDSLLSELFAIQATSRTECFGKDAQDPSVKKSPSALREESEKDPDDFVKADAQTFEHKFDTVRAQFDQLKQTVRRESDRIIDEVQKQVRKGPHQRILNRVCVSRQGWTYDSNIFQDMYYIWREQVRRRTLRYLPLLTNIRVGKAV
jgi:hypothetical protein